MKITLIQVGGTVDNYLKSGVDEYVKRLSHYTKFSTLEISDLKNASKMSREELKKKEGKEILKKLSSDDFVVLLDERGKLYSSEDFSVFIQGKMNQSVRSLVFIIGGAFGFSEDVYNRANSKLSLSKMTFSHRMIRLLFTEQLYRAFTILRNEPYHH
ncbi:MAG: 23S rRNA (pseudouridine(1915)-N(3))-methyltransferase RlmH [Lentisphaeraceae bacterium]|nr:23S rRNA (pseudouridine(1915)-N(3))-methyltransferase RlmH [Lentisphaeraceae bacterium]